MSLEGSCFEGLVLRVELLGDGYIFMKGSGASLATMEDSFGTLKPFLFRSSLRLSCHGVRINFHYALLLPDAFFTAARLTMAPGTNSSEHVLQYEPFLSFS